jgi:alpha-mannosidase
VELLCGYIHTEKEWLMLKHPEITQRRIEQFVQHTLRPQLWAESVPMEAAVYRPQGESPRDYREMKIDPVAAQRAEYTPVNPGYRWGPIWSDAWFRLQGRIPEGWRGQAVVARINTGAEAIVWEGDNPVQGIDNHHGELLVTEEARGGEEITLFVQATGMNPYVSVSGRPRDPDPAPFTFQYAELALYDRELFAFYFDVNIAYQVMLEQPQDSPRYGQLLYALNEVVNLYEPGDRETLREARRRLAEVYLRPASPSSHQISAIGHAHIDTAWLWPLERTQYKCIHTFATATRYMDFYPEYKFICSQAAQYEWVKHMAPKLYERIREKIKSGQWEVTGSMWVEADCNLSSGESLVRQILHGKNFFMEEFGIETKDLWLPDVFGYAAALPQILKKARIDYFLTQKISWNQFNKFPHHTFLWQGIDGTRIFTHFPPADTYNAMMTPKELAYNVRNFRENDRATRSLYVYGFGDGGGGPTIEMLENAARLKDVEGMPKVSLEKASDFFKKAEAEAKDLPVWVGELYLELHRGTYTTQARNKRGNRKSEFALRDAEFLSIVSPKGLTNYPQETLDKAWKTTLLNQFHDIIPGSSVNEVYRDSAKDYASILQKAAAIIHENETALAAEIDTTGLRRPVMVWSNLSHFANEVVSMPIGADEKPVAALGPEGDVMPVQIETRADGTREALFLARNVPLHGYAVWDLGATSVAPEIEDRVTVTKTSLENEAIRVEFDEATGLICRIYDKDCEREVLEPTRDADGRLLPERCANQFQLFEDKPLFWDAWDVDIYYQEKGCIITELESLEVVEWGPVRGALRMVRRFGNSRIVQTISLCSGSTRLDFHTEVDWHEDQKLLKVAFPVLINSPSATFEIQYGHVERPTHYNTSWDLARFEVCAQKWVDFSEGDYGVALLNDCKYGHDVHGNVMRISLLRSPKAPDPEADMGHHQFLYSLLPHAGDLREGEVIENAYAINCSLHTVPLPGNRKGSLPLQRSFFEVDNASVFIEAIKRAEKEDAVIVRLYEAHNTRGPVVLKTTLPVKRAYLTDLLETNLEELPLSVNGEVQLYIRPFEIITVKFTL